MPINTTRQAIAFADSRRVAHGPLEQVALAVAAQLRATPNTSVLVFDAHDSTPIELDLRGSDDVIRERYQPVLADQALADTAASSDAFEPRGRGRPRLGVIAREVTLLPRHWDWLATQSGGASVALRRLVEQARSQSEATERRRTAVDTAYRFLHAIAGNAPGYEDALRALYAGDRTAFEARMADWPKDVRTHALTLLDTAAPPSDTGALATSV
jgi:uncharacterized protein